MKAVIFDMDGVIFDSERLFVVCWKKIAPKYHLENIQDFCIAATGANSQKTKEIFMNMYGEEIPYDEIVKEVREEFHRHVLPVKPGAQDILSFLHENHIPVSLASSTVHPVVVQELMDAGLFQYFDEIITGDMVSKSKPEPDIFLLAAKKLGVKPKECFVVEDSFNGITAADRANMKSIMVPDLKQPDATIQKHIFKVMANLLEVKKYFQTEFQIDKVHTEM